MRNEPKGLRPVPDYPGYAVDMDGDLYRIHPNKIVKLKPRKRKGGLFARLIKDGKRKEIKLARIVWATFYGPIPPGLSVYHKNGIKTDNSPINLALVTKRELGKLANRTASQRIVMKTDPDGEVTFYRSAREAGRKNYMSYQTILDYCNGKNKKKIAPDGCRYEWEG